MTAVEPSSALVNYSQMANFTCQAFGIPVPNLRWLKEANGNVTVNDTDSIKIIEQMVTPFILESVLVFLNTTKTDQSLYRCEGSNGITNVIEFPEEDFVMLLVNGMAAANYCGFGFTVRAGFNFFLCF